MTLPSRRIWLPWLLLLVPTFVIGAVAVVLLRLEQRSLTATARAASEAAAEAARSRARVTGENMELLVDEIRDGIISQLAETPPDQREALLLNWPATNPFVASTFLWSVERGEFLWPLDDEPEHAAFKSQYATLFPHAAPTGGQEPRRQAAQAAPLPAPNGEANQPATERANETRKRDFARMDVPAANKDAVLDAQLPTFYAPQQAANSSFNAQEMAAAAINAYNVSQARSQRQAVQQINRESAERAKQVASNEDQPPTTSARRGFLSRLFSPSNEDAATGPPAPASSSSYASSSPHPSAEPKAEVAQAVPAAASEANASVMLGAVASDAAPEPSEPHPVMAGAKDAAQDKIAFDARLRLDEPGQAATPSLDSDAQLPLDSTASITFDRGTSAVLKQQKVEGNAKVPQRTVVAFDATKAARPVDRIEPVGSAVSLLGAATGSLADNATSPAEDSAHSGWERGGEGTKDLWLLGWWQAAPGADIVGVKLNLAPVIEQVRALVPAPTPDGETLTLLGPDDTLPDRREPSFRVPLASTLPGWSVAVSYGSGASYDGSLGQAFFIVASLLVAIFVAAILLGGLLFFRQAQQAAHEAASKTTFVANVSHEMKTPLTTLRMYAELLAEGRVSDEGKRRRYLDTIGRETARLARLVNNVLDFSRLEAGRKEYHAERVELAAALERAAELLGPRAADAGFVFEVKLVPRDAAVRCDRDSLEQVLLNLGDNALKYGAEGRDLALWVEAVTAEAHGSAAANSVGAWRIVVGDRGPGVAVAQRERIFERFHRVDDSLTARVQGVGLGLTIARRLARDQGGDLTCRPREGGGAEFVLTLPAAESTRAEPISP